MSHSKMECPNCGSFQIGRFRMDSDWAIRAGDWTSINPDDVYTEEQLKDFDNNSRPDVECFVCLQCELNF